VQNELGVFSVNKFVKLDQALAHCFLLFLWSILKYGFVEWVDFEWLEEMHKGLARLGNV
jgi:hypothetical protein